MQRAVPILPVDDLDAAREFYVEGLGFGVRFEHRGEAPNGLLGVEREGIVLTLDCPMTGHGRKACVSLEVQDADALFIEWSQRVQVERSPRNEGWGARTFDVRDPFGNTIFVIGPLSPQAARPIAQPVPELPVADVERAQQYYRDMLGFEIGWLEPGKEMGAVSRGDAVIFLRRRADDFQPSVSWVFAPDIDAAFSECRSSGATIAEPLETKPWGLRQFTVEDPDGNRFHFHTDAA